jgi:hypothetical protein
MICIIELENNTYGECFSTEDTKVMSWLQILMVLPKTKSSPIVGNYNKKEDETIGK